MNLQDFVKTTLVEIINGVKNAREELKDPSKEDSLISPVMSGIDGDRQPKGKHYIIDMESLVHMVDFDVAVTTTETDSVEGKAGISVMGMGFGAQGGTSSQDTSVSRIRFEVPVVYPQ